MRYIIIGAGAVGGAIGGRLAGAGHEVVLDAQGARYEALRAHGLRLVTPDGTHTYRLPTVDGPAGLGEVRADDVLVLAVRTQGSEGALAAWGPFPSRVAVLGRLSDEAALHRALAADGWEPGE